MRGKSILVSYRVPSLIDQFKSHTNYLFVPLSTLTPRLWEEAETNQMEMIFFSERERETGTSRNFSSAKIEMDRLIKI